MLIPEFKLNQNNTHVIVSIRLPYIKVTSCEFFIDEKEFKFFLKPYLLNLSFEQPLKEGDQPDKAIYYHEKYILEVMLLKKNEGQFFENLNLLSSIIGNKGKKKAQHKKPKVLVEVIGEQQHKVEETGQSGNHFSYGFCNNYHNVFKNLEEEAEQLFFFNPQTVPLPDRFELSKKIATEDFDESMYLFDKISNFEEIDRVIEGQQTNKTIHKLLQVYRQNHPTNDYEKFKFNMKIPAKELIIRKKDQPNIIKQFLSISICYLYELECMDGEMSVESSKTINRACSVFSCLTDFSELSVKKVIIDSLRRCIVYSLYKHIDICRKVLSNLIENLCGQFLTVVILNLRQLFDKSECRYLLNRIFLDDLAVYLLAGKNQVKVEQMLSQMHIKQQIKNTEIGLNEQILDLDVEINEELEMSSSNVGGQLEQLLKLD